MLRLYLAFLFLISLIATNGGAYQKEDDWIKHCDIHRFICDVCEIRGTLQIYNRHVLECSNCKYLTLISDYKNQLYSISICKEIKLNAQDTKI